MSNRRLYIAILCSWIFLTIPLVNTAYQHGFWREFVVSEFVLVVTSISLVFFVTKIKKQEILKRIKRRG